MASPLRLPVYVTAGILISMGLLFAGMVSMIRSPVGPIVFWVGEVVLLVVVWRSILATLGPDIGFPARTPRGSGAIRVAMAVSAFAFLALWVFAVGLSGGRTALPVLVAYATASGALLFLASLPSRGTGVADRLRMPLLTGGVFVMTVVGFLFMVG